MDKWRRVLLSRRRGVGTSDPDPLRRRVQIIVYHFGGWGRRRRPGISCASKTPSWSWSWSQSRSCGGGRSREDPAASDGVRMVKYSPSEFSCSWVEVCCGNRLSRVQDTPLGFPFRPRTGAAEFLVKEKTIRRDGAQLCVGGLACRTFSIIVEN